MGLKKQSSLSQKKEYNNEEGHDNPETVVTADITKSSQIVEYQTHKQHYHNNGIDYSRRC